VADLDRALGTQRGREILMRGREREESKMKKKEQKSVK
jgi:hypothetical protein